jgi:hypothetical protein
MTFNHKKKLSTGVTLAVSVSALALVLTACTSSAKTDASSAKTSASVTVSNAVPTKTAPQDVAPTKSAGTSASAKPTSANGDTATMPISDGDWRLDSVRVADNGLGTFGATARITYTGSDSKGGTNLFTLTVFKGGSDISALTGSASDVAPGKQVTVDFIGTDKFVSGPYTYDFQKNL